MAVVVAVVLAAVVLAAAAAVAVADDTIASHAIREIGEKAWPSPLFTSHRIAVGLQGRFQRP